MSHSMRNKKPLKRFVTDWAFCEGVFETPGGKWIARVRVKGRYNTISQHDKKKDAEAALRLYKSENNL